MEIIHICNEQGGASIDPCGTPVVSNLMPDEAHRCNRRIDTLRPRQNGRHFPDDIFKCISWMESMNFDYDFTEVCS